MKWFVKFGGKNPVSTAKSQDRCFGITENENTGYITTLLQVKAKVHIGYDLKKIEIIPNIESKTIILKKFPHPEVLAFENDYKIKKVIRLKLIIEFRELNRLIKLFS